MAAGRCVGGEELRDLQPAAVGFLSENGTLRYLI